MPKYFIDATYSYSAEIEANTPEEAESLFLDDLNVYYSGTDSLTIEEYERDEEETE